MTRTFLDFIKSKLGAEPPVHPLDGRIAKRWVKERLKKLYPELRADAVALEKAYQELGMEAREGSGKGGRTIFEITLPGQSD